MTLRVNEIFYSIQGESTYAGYPCAFIRLTGCNLRCTYCDTRYAYEEGKELEIINIVNKVSAYNCPLVEVTGGEPLIQEKTPFLIRKLIGMRFTVLMETNGSQDIDRVDDRCIRIVDIKCPSSKEHTKNDLNNLNRLSTHDEIKFVIGNRNDYEFARQMVVKMGEKPNPIHFSPIFGQIEPDKLAEWVLKDGLNVRIHLQLHKIIWSPDRKGV